MAHMLEVINGKASMAYAGEMPWHNLGTKVPPDLTPAQMLEAANLNWEVETRPTFYKRGKNYIPTGDAALIRKSDQRLFGTVSDDWKPVQNAEAAEFFNDFVAEGGMSMETAGALQDGELVWMLAKMGESFDVFKNRDTIDAYCLFTNPHKYGFSTSVSLTAVRVVCWNTLNLSLNSTKGDKIVKVSHKREFIADEVKSILGVTAEKMKTYKAMAQFLASKKAKDEDIVTYLKRIFPVITSKVDGSKKDMSKLATMAYAALETQPGAEHGAGTWWAPFNAVTYTLDHNAGRNADSRLTSAWYGDAKKKKLLAAKVATEMADA